MSYNILYSTLANARKSHRVISSISTTRILEDSVLKRRHGLVNNSLQYNVKSYFVNIHHSLPRSFNERYLHSTVTGGFCFKGVEEKNQICKQDSLPTVCYYRNNLVNGNKSTQSSKENDEKIEKINTTFVKPRSYSRSRLQNLVWTQNKTVSNKNCSNDFVTKKIHNTDGKLKKEILNKTSFNESESINDLKSSIKLAAKDQFSTNFPSKTILTVDIVPGFKNDLNISSPFLKFEPTSGQNKNKSDVNLIKTTKIKYAQKSKSDKEISINASHNKFKDNVELHLKKKQASLDERVNLLRNKSQSNSSPNLLPNSNDEFVPQIRQKSTKKRKYNELYKDVEISKMEFPETSKTINSEKNISWNEDFRSGVEKPTQPKIVWPPLPSKRRPRMDLVNVKADEINIKNKIETICENIDLKLHSTSAINRILRPAMPKVKISKKTNIYGLLEEDHSSSILPSVNFKRNVNDFFHNSNNLQIKPQINGKMLLDYKLMGTSFESDPLHILNNKYNSSRDIIEDKNDLLKNISSSKSKQREITLSLKSHIKTWKIYRERRKTAQESMSQLYKSISGQKKLNITKKSYFFTKLKERKKCSVIAIPINPMSDINKQFHKTVHTKIKLDRKKNNNKIIPSKSDPTEIMKNKHKKGWKNYKSSFKDIMKEKEALILVKKIMKRDEVELGDNHKVIDEEYHKQKNNYEITKSKGGIKLNEENLKKLTEKEFGNLSKNVKKITALSQVAMTANMNLMDTGHKEGSITVKEINSYPSGYRKRPEFIIKLLSMNKNYDKKLADEKNTDPQINKHPNIEEKTNDFEGLCQLDKHDNIVLNKTFNSSLKGVKNGFEELCICKSDKHDNIVLNKVVNSSSDKVKSDSDQTNDLEAVCKSESDNDNNMVLNGIAKSSLENEKSENKIISIIGSENVEKPDEQCRTDSSEVTHSTNEEIKKLEKELERLKKLMAFNKKCKIASIASEKKLIPKIHPKFHHFNSPLDNEHCHHIDIDVDEKNLPMSREDKFMNENSHTEKNSKKITKVCPNSDFNKRRKNEILFGLSDRNRQSEKAQRYYNEQEKTSMNSNIENKIGLMKKNEKMGVIDGAEPKKSSNNQSVNCQFEGMVNGEPRTMKEKTPESVDIPSVVTQEGRFNDSTQQAMTNITSKQDLSRVPLSICNEEVDQLHHYPNNKEFPEILSKHLNTVNDPLVDQREDKSNSEQIKEQRMAILENCCDNKTLLKINTLTGSLCIPGNSWKKNNQNVTMNKSNTDSSKINKDITNNVKYYLSSMRHYLNRRSSAIKKWTKFPKFVASNSSTNHKIKQNESFPNSEAKQIFCSHDPALESSNKNHSHAPEPNKLGLVAHEQNKNKTFPNSEVKEIFGTHGHDLESSKENYSHAPEPNKPGLVDHKINRNKSFPNSEVREIFCMHDQALENNTNRKIEENIPFSLEMKQILAPNIQGLGNSHKNDKSTSEAYQPDILQQNVDQITGEAIKKSTSANFLNKEACKNLDCSEYNRRLLSYSPRTIKKPSKITTHKKAPVLTKEQFKISNFNKQLEKQILSQGENILGKKKNCGSFLDKAQVKGFNYCRDYKSPFYHIPKQMVLKSEKTSDEGKSAFRLKNDAKLYHITKQSIKKKPSKMQLSEIAEKIRLKEALNILKKNGSREKLSENPEAYWFDYNPQHFDIETTSNNEYFDYMRKRKHPTT